MLTVLGLTDAEQALYELLLARPSVTEAELGPLLEAARAQAGPGTGAGTQGATAARTEDPGTGAAPGAAPWAGSAPGTAVRARLRRLEQLGLLARLPEDPPRYVVAPPGEALDEALIARDRELAAARRRVAELTARAARPPTVTDPLDLVEIAHGPEAVTRWHDRLQRGARKEIRAFDSPPYINDHHANPLELEQLRRGIRYRAIYDRRALGLPGGVAFLDDFTAAGEIARVVDDVPIKLVLSDEPLAMLPLREAAARGAWLIVHGSVLYDGLSALFETYWERALPLRFASGRGDGPRDGPSLLDRALLTLLTAGHTEDAIAEHLGWHKQTVRRHLTDLMRRLDATSRFQAGYQAVRRGWLRPDDEAHPSAEAAALGAPATAPGGPRGAAGVRPHGATPGGAARAGR
ncbi:LuxR C-terminal-related transcriptional regulator [Streptomyces sp. NPDC021224]|uniref:LuxR C-terminal-related transcriptional regulator n=1 Tax=unclassified Streptomyces TaxID=2593676 RepID=UPI00378D564F